MPWETSRDEVDVDVSVGGGANPSLSERFESWRAREPSLSERFERWRQPADAPPAPPPPPRTRTRRRSSADDAPESLGERFERWRIERGFADPPPLPRAPVPPPPPPPRGPSYYDLLGVDPCASEAEISRAYRKMALSHHPDRARDKARASAAMAELNAARGVLLDAHARRRYDIHRRVGVAA